MKRVYFCATEGERNYLKHNLRFDKKIGLLAYMKLISRLSETTLLRVTRYGTPFTTDELESNRLALYLVFHSHAFIIHKKFGERKFVKLSQILQHHTRHCRKPRGCDCCKEMIRRVKQCAK